MTNVNDQLRAWGAAHAEARRAEGAAERSGDAETSAELRSNAASLRQRADQLHREIYRSLGRERKDAPR